MIGRSSDFWNSEYAVSRTIYYDRALSAAGHISSYIQTAACSSLLANSSAVESGVVAQSIPTMNAVSIDSLICGEFGGAEN